jgi:hypothetical protein
MRERDIINEALVYSSKDIQNAFEAGVKSIKDKLPSLEGIEHVEKCDYCKDWTKISANCPYCHGTGEITRQAEWGEVMEMVMYCFNPGQIKLFDIDRNGNIQFILKSGGRLRVKEKP